MSATLNPLIFKKLLIVAQVKYMLTMVSKSLHPGLVGR
jgi:hypothetical protein